MSEVKAQDVCKIVEEARTLLQKQEGAKVKKKIILKKNSSAGSSSSKKQNTADSDDKDVDFTEIFNGAELSTVPYGSYLLIYTDGASSGNPGHAGIGIHITDKDNRTVGKVSSYVGVQTNNYAEYVALIRALKIAIYFKTKDLKLRTDSELAVKQIKGIYKVSSENIKPLYDEMIRLKKKVNSFRIEHIPRAQNDKADYLAKTAASNRK
ncbi:MAG: ribonuclease HI family protein [Spirochaetes bacterium]|nr:ribonuclease HI family protein [Spirochaetota bacterium]